MACSKHANYANLDNYLEGVAESLNFSQSCLEVKVVQQLVHKMVHNIAKEAYRADSGLTLREIIPVGSMAEGTRIILPNEFDFMIVVDRIDADDVRDTISDSKGTFVRMKIECREENCMYSIEDPSVDYISAFGSECNCHLAKLTKEMCLYSILCATADKILEDGHSYSSESHPGKLQLIECKRHLPALTLTLLWKACDVEDEPIQMEISVDLVVMVELEIDACFLDRTDVFHQHFYNELNAIKKVHIRHDWYLNYVGFRVSFVFTELQLIRDDSETHKTCYKLLKYIYRTNNIPFERFCSSFLLKNLLLQHAVCCEGGGLGWCLLKILGELRDKLDSEGSEIPFIPHVFSTKVDLLSTKFGDMSAGMVSWSYHRKEISDFMEILERFRDGSPIPSTFQFKISNNIQIR